jgi:hypothetical protein
MTETVATLCFAFAIAHTFSVQQFQRLAHRYREGSAGENFFHLLGEVEVVFGIWAAIFILYLAVHQGSAEAIGYLESRNFTEPAFVFVIMTVCSTRPILRLAGLLIEGVARFIPARRPVAFYASALTLGPILGSFITEPAAMTVTALILLERFLSKDISSGLKYATLGLLFVNVSIGGTLTPYAAPPVLMVASKWGWDLGFMFGHFGWKAVLCVLISTTLVTFRFRKELADVVWRPEARVDGIPAWVVAIHLLALTGVVVGAHHIVVFMPVFFLFLGIVRVTREYQAELKLREGLLVAFFLGGLVVLGGPQRWWLEPILTRLETLPLYLGALSLTAITDNAALTYLGAQVPSLNDASRYALVAGAVVGGGLTVIANAPNPAGYGILNPAFGEDGISPVRLFASAIPPTLVAAAIFWLA